MQEGKVVGKGQGLQVGVEGAEAGWGGGSEGLEFAGGVEAAEGVFDAEEQAVLGVFEVGNHEVYQAAGIPHGGEETGGEGIALQVRDAGEQDDGDFSLLGDDGEGVQIALDFGAGGIVGGGEEQIGIVDQDQTDGFVHMQQFGEGIEIIEREGSGTAAGLLAVDLGILAMDLGEDKDLIGIDAQGLQARF